MEWMRLAEVLGTVVTLSIVSAVAWVCGKRVGMLAGDFSLECLLRVLSCNPDASCGDVVQWLKEGGDETFRDFLVRKANEPCKGFPEKAKECGGEDRR